MRIGTLAEQVGTSARTLRFYEQVGVLPQPTRTNNGYRDYDESMIARLEFVHAAQTAGWTLAEIRGVLRIRDLGDAPCTHVEDLIAAKLDEVDARIADLETTRRELRSLARRAGRLDPADCRDVDICHILTRP